MVYRAQNRRHFSYLKSANIDVEIQHMVRCAWIAYGRLAYSVFSEIGFWRATKIRV